MSQVVGNTFEEVIESSNDVLLMLYGDYSWCEHCKIYAPEFDLIGKTADHIRFSRATILCDLLALYLWLSDSRILKQASNLRATPK